MALSLEADVQGIDPITFSVIFHRLQTINKEMGITMMRTSRSQIFAEVHDFSCAICDWVPRIVAQVLSYEFIFLMYWVDSLIELIGINDWLILT